LKDIGYLLQEQHPNRSSVRARSLHLFVPAGIERRPEVLPALAALLALNWPSEVIGDKAAGVHHSRDGARYEAIANSSEANESAW
jgi:hypothetical protein